MSRLFAFAVALVIGIQSAYAGTLERVRDSGVFRIGYRADAKPYSYLDDHGKAAGYIVDLCVEVAKAIGPNIRTEFVLIAANQRFEALRDDIADILCEPSSITMARREMVDFSIPTFLDGASVLSRTSKPVRGFEDMVGKRVGVLQNTTTEQVLRAALGNLNLKATILPVRDHRVGFSLLSDSRIDAYFADRGIAMALIHEGGQPGFQVSQSYFSYETYALALPRNDSAFRLFVDRELAQLYRSGRIKAILEKTFGRVQPRDMLNAMFVINSLPEK